MARGRPGGNPDIIKQGKKTQFQKGHKLTNNRIPPELYRKNLLYLSLQPLKIKYLKDGLIDMDHLQRQLQKLMHDGKGETSPARMIALRMIERVFTQMEPSLVKELIENTEGKLPDTITLSQPEKAPTEFVSDEEASAAYAKYMKQ